ETKKYERLTDTGSVIDWLPDGRRILYRDKNSLLTVDAATKKTQTVLEKLGPGVGFANMSLARDGRTVLLVRADNQSDIWMLGPTEPGTKTP
ncbi:MAG: hypothetical protein L0191_13980, partial [Acidobacteria bacterium]|nr:hypothetical protein [Acidobacteriota bacterium]